MSTAAVSFDDVSKLYRLRHAPSPGASRDFWAVKHVSLAVRQGETLGIIGHNGAGKSTILKMLSRITAPTSGTITVTGRLAALIEVGSGFHPELTGRDNVFLSGAILGMRRREIAAKFDRIVEFAGVGSFIDVPVKWYSSGMYVRLGFSIAAHLDADVLLVDEVLAVGDAAFQTQCVERIQELRQAGTTMIFISHDLSSIGQLCDRVALMDHGRIVAAGDPMDVIREYGRVMASTVARDAADASGAAGAAASPAPAHIADVRFFDPVDRELAATATGSWLRARVDVDVASPINDAVVEVFYYSRDGRTLHCQHSTALEGGALRLQDGRQVIEFTCAEIGLQPGTYQIGAAVRERLGPGTLDWWYGARLLHVHAGKSVRGHFYAPHTWRLVDVAATAEHHPADV